MHRRWLLLALIGRTGAAAAEPESAASGPDRAPAPLLLPDLAAGHRFGASLMLGLGPNALATTMTLAGTITLGRVALFAAGPFTYAIAPCDSDGCEDSIDVIGNLRAGARYRWEAGPFAMAPSVWAWLPTTTASRLVRVPGSRLLGGPTMGLWTGLDDSRAFVDLPAVGFALDAGWRGEGRFVQAEIGAALVLDDGAHVDNIFAALGAGARTTSGSSLLVEARIDAYPRSAPLVSLGFGIGLGQGRRPSWRFRVHPGYHDGSFGVALGIDATWGSE